MSKDAPKMVRVPAPEWAAAYNRGQVKFDMVADKYGDALRSDERDALLQRREDIHALVDKLVHEYVIDQCAPLGERWWPEQARLTGDYYIARESYHRWVGEPWIQVCVSAHCVGTSGSKVGDYLGLDVWLRYEPEGGRLSNHRNTDSMSI